MFFVFIYQFALFQAAILVREMQLYCSTLLFPVQVLEVGKIQFAYTWALGIVYLLKIY